MCVCVSVCVRVCVRVCVCPVCARAAYGLLVSLSAPPTAMWASESQFLVSTTARLLPFLLSGWVLSMLVHK